MDKNIIKLTGMDKNGNAVSYTDISIEYMKTMIDALPEGAAAYFLLSKVKEIIKEIEEQNETKNPGN